MSENIEYPTSWVRLELGDVISYGETIRAEPDEIPADAWVLELEDIEKDTSKLLQRLTFAQRQSKSTKNRFSRGDILYGKLRPYLNKVLVADRDGYCTTEIIPIKPNEAIHGRYLFYWLKHPEFLGYVDSMSHGLNMPRLGTKAGLVAPFILAPLNEQKRIADKLDALLARVDACRARLNRVPEIIKRFRQAVLAIAYTGEMTNRWRTEAVLTPITNTLNSVETPPRPNRFSSQTDIIIDGDYALAVGPPDRQIPPGWKWVPLVDIARMESGHTPSRSHPEYWRGDVPWIGIADARDNHAKTIMTTYQHTNQLGLANSAARLLSAGTVCLSRTASVGYVVRMGVPMATSQDFVNWTCTHAINPDWLKYLFVAEAKAIHRFGKGTTHTTIYFPELMAFHVTLPPIEEQYEIVKRIEALFAYADSLEAHYRAAYAQVGHLTSTLLSKAFRGELIPQDPNDEPASTLLERIRILRAITPVQIKKPARRPKMGKKLTRKGHEVGPIDIVNVLREAGKELASDELLTATGFLTDANSDSIEAFLVAIRDALRNNKIAKSRRNDRDWFSLVNTQVQVTS